MPADCPFRWQICCYIKLYQWVKHRLSQCANGMLYICHIVNKQLKDYRDCHRHRHML